MHRLMRLSQQKLALSFKWLSVTSSSSDIDSQSTTPGDSIVYRDNTYNYRNSHHSSAHFTTVAPERSSYSLTSTRLLRLTVEMSTLEELDNLEREGKEQQDDQGKKQDGDAQMKDADQKKDELDDIFDEEILRSSTRDIINRRKLLENDMRVMKSEFQRLTHEQNTMKEKIKDNVDKIENNRFVLVLRFGCAPGVRRAN